MDQYGYNHDFTLFSRRNVKWIHLFFLEPTVKVLWPLVMLNSVFSIFCLLQLAKNKCIHFAFLLEKIVFFGTDILAFSKKIDTNVLIFAPCLNEVDEGGYLNYPLSVCPSARTSLRGVTSKTRTWSLWVMWNLAYLASLLPKCLVKFTHDQSWPTFWPSLDWVKNHLRDGGQPCYTFLKILKSVNILRWQIPTYGSSELMNEEEKFHPALFNLVHSVVPHQFSYGRQTFITVHL